VTYDQPNNQINRNSQPHLTHFVDDPPSIAQGGRGVRHHGNAAGAGSSSEPSANSSTTLTHDVLPSLIDKLSTEGKTQKTL
jgi:hypothetical protein